MSEESTGLTRRKYLESAGTVGLAALAGCLGGGPEGEGSNEGSNQGSNATDRSGITATEEGKIDGTETAQETENPTDTETEETSYSVTDVHNPNNFVNHEDYSFGVDEFENDPVDLRRLQQRMNKYMVMERSDGEFHKVGEVVVDSIAGGQGAHVNEVDGVRVIYGPSDDKEDLVAEGVTELSPGKYRGATVWETEDNEWRIALLNDFSVNEVEGEDGELTGEVEYETFQAVNAERQTETQEMIDGVPAVAVQPNYKALVPNYEEIVSNVDGL